MNRTLDYYRMVRAHAIHHKSLICRKVYRYEWFKKEERGRYSKNKIHCSCWMCSRKSNIEADFSEKRSALKAFYDLEEVSEDFYIKKYKKNIYSRTKSLNSITYTY